MDSSYWSRWHQRRLSRRAWLRTSLIGISGAAVLGTIGCGDDDDDDDEASSSPTAATANPTSVPVKRGGRATLGQATDFIGLRGLDPHTSTTQSGLWRSIFDVLLAVTPDGNIDADSSLAKTHEIPNDTRFVFHLREGVKFHDGTELDAEAIKFNFMRAKDTSIKGGGIYAVTYAVIDSIEATDKYTVAFNLTRPDAALIANLSERGGMITSPTHSKATQLEDLRTQPVGTGPYKLASWKSDQTTSLVPFEDHWRKRADGGRYALLDEMLIKVIPDPIVQVASLQGGEIDVLSSAPASQLDLLFNDKNLNPNVFKGGLHLSWWINMLLAPADNADFRRSLMWAWDKEATNKVFYQGRAEIADSILTSASWAHKSVAGYPGFDMTKAKDFMAKSGIPESERVMEVVPTSADTTTILQAMAKQWEQLGVTIKFAPSSEFQARAFKNAGAKGDVQMFSSGGHRGEPDTYLRQALTEKGSWNIGAAPLPTVEPLVNKAVTTYKLEERKAIYSEIQDLQAQDLLSWATGLFVPTFGFSGKGVTGLSNDFNGYEFWKDLGRI
ncbi:MAG: ABC transporter substrate-binding protein [Dehalococcoidia bacterium]